MASAKAEQYRRILRVQVQNLFGLYDHEIVLNHDDRITIIHGPNGVGKTVLLRMISALFGGRYSETVDVPFSNLSVWLDGNAAFHVTRKKADAVSEAKASDPVIYSLLVRLVADGAEYDYLLDPMFGGERLAEKIAAEHPYLVRIGHGQWEDDRDGEVITTHELIDRYSGRGVRRVRGTAEEPAPLRQMRSAVQTHVIEAQRLIQVSGDAERFSMRRAPISRLSTTVQKYSEDLKQRLLEATARYAGQSQSLDQTFPRRLMALSNDLSPEELRGKLDELDKDTAKLSKLGLLTLTQSYPVSTGELDRLDGAQRRVMTLYVQDTAQKLSVLTELADRVQLLLGSVNGKFRNKKVRVAKDSGITIEGVTGEPIDLDALSSGEQHELVLLYDLLFRVKPNTLVLIDEPELSLHVTWQKKFLPELIAIVNTAKFDAIVATHSPFIVGGRRDLMVALDAEPDAQESEVSEVG